MSETKGPSFDFNSLLPRLAETAARADARPLRGRVLEIRGVVVRASLPSARVGELCTLRDPASGRSATAEVVGFDDGCAILTPIGDLDGLSTQAEVVGTGQPLRVPVGEALLGRVVSPLGTFLDAAPAGGEIPLCEHYPVLADPPPPLRRQVIGQPLHLGIRAIDGLLTVARGQRVGIFGEPGAGKSSLLAAIVGGTEADVVVVGLIGERGREVREFVDVLLDKTARRRTVTVVATSDRPAMERVKAAHAATAIAEYFRDQGRDVLLLMDSVTRFARAQREIGLAAGEPPTRRGFPPSLFAALPRLLERSGPGPHGSITALYTVLTEGEQDLDPVAEETKAILDGHIVLDGALAQRDHFPAIDILRSRSRLMSVVASAEHKRDAGRIREMMARYRDVELMLRIGEYRSGSDAAVDEAVAKHKRIEAFLRQDMLDRTDAGETLRRMAEIAA